LYNAVGWAHTERSCYDFITPGVVERDRINHITMTFKSQQFFPSFSSPDFTSSVITSSDEFVTLLVKCAIRQRQNMRPENLE